MSTLDVLNAISEAHAALVRTPELEAQIKALTDERDFVKLERDEAELTIQRLKARITELENDLIRERQDNLQKSNEIGDLSNRNTHLDETVNSLTRRVENLTATKNEQIDLITALRMDKAALEVRLDDAKGYGAKLAETLKGIGQSIVKAVEVPEVTSDKPFPVADSMGLSDQTNAERPDTDGLMVDPIMAESTAPAVVESPKEDTAAGCFPYRYW